MDYQQLLEVYFGENQNIKEMQNCITELRKIVRKNNNKFIGIQKNSKSSNGLINQTNSEKILIFPAYKIDTGLKDGIYPKGEYGTKSYKITLLDDTEVKKGFFVKDVKLLGKFK